jgi:predicted metal-binding membrane protein
MTRRPLAASRPAPAQRLVLGAAGLGTLALAWGLLARAAAGGHHGWHGQAPGLSASPWATAVAMWQLMMIAMMLPVVWPWLRMVSVTHARPDRGPTRDVVTFAGGYFAAWLLYSLVAGTAQLWLQDQGRHLGASLALGSVAGGATLMLAGAFQFTPLKRACLTHCRNPIGYLLASWADGPPSLLRLGFTHGLHCVACCWALMSLGFALGLMNLAWMAVITVIAALEQLAPGGHRIARIAGTALIAWGVGLMLESQIW